MTDVTSWSEIDASNNSAPPGGAPEGMAFSATNDVMRAIMGGVRRLLWKLTGVYASGGSSNAYTLTPSAALSAYSTGERYSFRASFANTGAATLNISSLGAKSIKKMTASGKADLAPGDIQQGQPVTVEYDGTDMVMVTPVASLARTDATNTFSADQVIRSDDDGSGAGPTLTLDRNSESPSASDAIGAIALRGRDSGGDAVTYANILGAIIDATAGAAKGQLILQTLVNGSLQNALLLREGVVVGSPTGGDKGAGKINAEDVLINGDPARVLVQRAYAEYTQHTSITAVIPADDTVPQITEGTQLLQVSITPKSASNRIRIRFHAPVFLNNGAVAAALFRNGTTNAIATSAINVVGNISSLYLEYEDTPGSTDEQTYSIRIGPSGGTMYVNGTGAGRFYGGTLRAMLVAEEIKA